jgi:hypothetical protein
MFSFVPTLMRERGFTRTVGANENSSTTTRLLHDYPSAVGVTASSNFFSNNFTAR